MDPALVQTPNRRERVVLLRYVAIPRSVCLINHLARFERGSVVREITPHRELDTDNWGVHLGVATE